MEIPKASNDAAGVLRSEGEKTSTPKAVSFSPGDIKQPSDVTEVKQAATITSYTAMTSPLTNGGTSINQKSVKMWFPPSQSPIVTLLKKNREGAIPKGAAYIGSSSSTADSDKILSEVMDYLEKESASLNANAYCPNGNGKLQPTRTDSKVAKAPWSHQTCVETGPITSHQQVVRQIVPKTNGDLTQRNGTAQLQKLRPKRIEDYEPGNSSIALFDPSVDKDYNPPIVKPGQFSQYTESDTEFEYRIRKKNHPMSPSQSDNSVHDLYRKVQKGGHIPPEGLKYPPAEAKRSFSVPTPPAQEHRRLGQTVSDSGVKAIITRQQRDQQNALRKLELNRLIEEERKKKMEQERQDIQSRRHSDFFMPSQKSPVPLNRYEDNTDERISLALPTKKKLGSKIRGKAKALYNFKAQNDRELTFRKGDIIYLIQQIDKNWFEGERHGAVGRFPISYVEVIVSLDVAQAAAAESEGLARALYNFFAQSSVEMSLRKGDLVKLIRRVDENWYEGRTGTQRGIFPVRYVETLMEPDVPDVTPMSSRTVTPMIGSPATLSPTSSIFSLGPAPTIPSAPLSPVDSELMDETQWNTEFWCSSPAGWTTNSQPAITASRHYQERDGYAPGHTRALYYSSGGLDELYSSAPAQPSRPLSRSSSAGPPVDNQLCYYGIVGEHLEVDGFGQLCSAPKSSFANDVRNLTRSYHFENTSDGLPVKPWPPVKDQRFQEADFTSKYLHLRYPPYRANYKYVPRNTDELSLNVGDVVYVVEKCEDGWYVGFSERTKGFGTFPGNYVQRLW